MWIFWHLFDSLGFGWRFKHITKCITLFKNLTFPINTVQPLLQLTHGAAQIGHRLLQHFPANKSRTMLLSGSKSLPNAPGFRSNLLHFSLLVEFSLQPRQVVFTVVAVSAHLCEDERRKVCASRFPWKPSLPVCAKRADVNVTTQGRGKWPVIYSFLINYPLLCSQVLVWINLMK